VNALRRGIRRYHGSSRCRCPRSWMCPPLRRGPSTQHHSIKVFTADVDASTNHTSRPKSAMACGAEEKQDRTPDWPELTLLTDGSTWPLPPRQPHPAAAVSASRLELPVPLQTCGRMGKKRTALSFCSTPSID
jgi:hypothetical protein